MCGLSTLISLRTVLERLQHNLGDYLRLKCPMQLHKLLWAYLLQKKLSMVYKVRLVTHELRISPVMLWEVAGVPERGV